MRADAMESAYNILNTLDIRLMNAIDNMQKAREDIAFLKQHLKGWAEEQANAQWVSVNDYLPQDNERVVVRTKDGATYFLHPISGKFPTDIVEWYRLPK